MKRLLYLPFFLGPGAAQDLRHALWLMPYASGTDTLQADSSGKVKLAPGLQADRGCWHLVSAGGGQFYILSNAFGGKRGLELRGNQPHLAEGRGAKWTLTPQSEGIFRVECPEGPLENHDWTLWSRQRLGRQPQSGNFVRSDLGHYWEVRGTELAGRAEPNPQAKILRTFSRGTVLTVDYGRGGSDEVLWNAVDEDGNTWIRVKDRQGKPLNCYVRANSAWLRPFDS